MAENEQIEVKESSEEKKHKSKNKWIAILVIAVLVIGICTSMVIYQNNQLEKSFYQVKSNKVIDNVRVVCIADMHLKEFGKDNEKLVKEISKLGPDIIAVVGDMNLENQPNNYDKVINLMTKLNETAPVYYSLGNHEIDAMLFKDSKIYSDIKNAGINIMNNEMETIDVKGTTVDVIGLTPNPKQFNDNGKAFFDSAMEDDSNFKLVLHHYPESFQGVIEDYNIDLALAGHAHGGQVRVPVIGGLYSADQGFLPKLCDGYHEIGNSKLVITRGLGKSGFFPRINNKPEITVVDIGWY